MYDTISSRKTVLELYDQRLIKCGIPYRERNIATSSGNTNVVIWGDTSNPPLVLLHGGQSNATLWVDIVPYLVNKLCLYAIDEIGDATGKTIPVTFPVKRTQYSPWLHDVIDSLGLTSFSIAGISYGSLIAIDYTLQYPDRIDKLITLSPAAGFAKMRVSPLVKSMWIGLFGGKQSYHKMLNLLRAPGVVSSEELYTFFECCMMHCKPGFEIPWYYKDEQLRSISRPVLLIIGKDEKFINRKKAFKRAEKLVPKLKSYEIPDCGHFSIGDQPGKIATMMLEFLNN